LGGWERWVGAIAFQRRLTCRCSGLAIAAGAEFEVLATADLDVSPLSYWWGCA
jgi:hypothetical protein